MKLDPQKAKRLTGPGRLRQTGERGMTLMEVLIASSLSLLVVGALLMTLTAVAREQQRSASDISLQREASLLQDKLINLLRSMSATESVAFGDAVQAGSPLYRRIVVAQGPGATHPREELFFDPAKSSLIYDPDRNKPNDESPVHKFNSEVILRNACFFASIGTGGVPDSSLLNIYLELDDNGAARRRNPDGTLKNTVLRRTFSVKMRNP